MLRSYNIYAALVQHLVVHTDIMVHTDIRCTSASRCRSARKPNALETRTDSHMYPSGSKSAWSETSKAALVGGPSVRLAMLVCDGDVRMGESSSSSTLMPASVVAPLYSGRPGTLGAVEVRGGGFMAKAGVVLDVCGRSRSVWRSRSRSFSQRRLRLRARVAMRLPSAPSRCVVSECRRPVGAVGETGERGGAS